MVALNVRAIIGIVISVIIGLAMIPVIASVCDDAIRGDLKYYTTATLNSAFSDNTGASPDNWDNVVTDNRTAFWNSGGYIGDNGDNGTCAWSQALVISNLHDGVSSATIKAKYKLADNVNITSITARALLDNSTDNITIWQSTSVENSTSYTSIENNVASYIIGTGTYTLRLWDNVATAGADNVTVHWDDASLTITTQGYEPMTGASKIMLQLVPLFYVIGIVLALVTWAIGKVRKTR